MGKILIFAFTYLPMMSINMMITCFSFNKNNIQNYFQVGDVFMSVMSAMLFILLAVGTFLKFTISNSLKPVQTVLWTSIVGGLGYIIIPIVSIAKPNGIGDISLGGRYAILIVLFVLFSFFSFAIFPSTFTIFCHSFNNKQHGALVGIWSSRGNIGHILGFVISQLLVSTFNVRWQVSMIVCSALYMLFCILLFLFVKNPQPERGLIITTKQCYQFFGRVWRERDFKFYIVLLGLFRAILYTNELWTPSYLNSIGLETFAGYIPAVFDLATIFGSFFIGFIYEKQLNSDSDSTLLRAFSKLKFLVASIIIVVICFLNAEVKSGVGAYFAFSALLGLFLGAIYNFLQNQQILTYCDGSPRKGDIYATCCTSISTVLLGVIELIIALGVTVGKTPEQSFDIIEQGTTYFIMAAIGFIAMIVGLLRSFYQYVKQHTDQQQLMIQMQKMSRRSSASSRRSSRLSELSYTKR